MFIGEAGDYHCFMKTNSPYYVCVHNENEVKRKSCLNLAGEMAKFGRSPVEGRIHDSGSIPLHHAASFVWLPSSPSACVPSLPRPNPLFGHLPNETSPRQYPNLDCFFKIQPLCSPIAILEH